MSLKIFGLSNSVIQAREIATILANIINDDDSIINSLQSYSCVKFADGELEVAFDEAVRGDDVFLVQSTSTPESIVELLLAIDAAKHASAKTVTAVIPYFGYARQDRKSKPRVSVGAKVFAKALESAGVDRVITLDLHASQEQCFFDVPVDHIPATSIFLPELLSKKDQLSNFVIASPDVGGAKRAEKYSRTLGLPLVLCHKHRSEANKVDSMIVIGDVQGKDVILVDDMIDTAGTICKAANLLKEKGAQKVLVIATHGLFSGPAIERINASGIDEVYVTDSYPSTVTSPKLHIVPSASLFAHIILSVYTERTISMYLV